MIWLTLVVPSYLVGFMVLYQLMKAGFMHDYGDVLKWEEDGKDSIFGFALLWPLFLPISFFCDLAENGWRGGVPWAIRREFTRG